MDPSRLVCDNKNLQMRVHNRYPCCVITKTQLPAFECPTLLRIAFDDPHPSILCLVCQSARALEQACSLICCRQLVNSDPFVYSTNTSCEQTGAHYSAATIFTCHTSCIAAESHAIQRLVCVNKRVEGRRRQSIGRQSCTGRNFTKLVLLPLL